MRIGARLTLATSTLVVGTLAIYAATTIRSRRTERQAEVEGQARELAIALRATVEARGFPALATDSGNLAGDLDHAGLPWKIAFVDAASALPPDAPPTSDAFAEALRTLVAIKAPVTTEARVNGKPTFVYLEPIREPTPFSPDGYRVLGAVRVSRDLTFLDDETRSRAIEATTSVLLLVGLVILAISLIARRGIGRPIAKLVDAIDGVARGDLSPVVYEERDDEIGALAGRFNQMTSSLRDARAETRRGLEAKLALEAQLRQSEKLATIGQLAAEIAHEVGTPLNVVSGRARAMGKRADDPEAVTKNAEIIAEQAARITRIIQRLLDFARRPAGDAAPARVDVGGLAWETLEFVEQQLASARIVADAQLDEDPAETMGDKDQLQQVLLNLYMNAIQAMPDGGTLTIATAFLSRRRPGLELAPEQRYVVLSIADTGVGIPPADREKVFEPFYTSKASAGGTGLGLAVAQGIIRDHDGWIEIDATHDGSRGTVFRVYLPVAPPEPSARGLAPVQA